MQSLTSQLGPIAVSLANNNSGMTLAATTTSSIGFGWQRYEFTLTTGPDVQPSTDNHLLLTVEHPGRVWLSLVSLFPPTYHDRVNGNRRDLMKMLADMDPTFLRMPGGNYLEGDDIQDRFDWKTALGNAVPASTLASSADRFSIRSRQTRARAPSISNW